MISSVAPSALVSFALSLVLTPAVRALCVRHGFFDFPGPLKIHSQPVPRLGGVAIALSIFAGMLIASRNDPRASVFVFAAFGVVWLAGLADDLRTISPYARLVAQVGAGILLWAGGYRLLVGNFLPPAGAVSLVLVSGLAVLFTNAFNFLDGSDGLAAGVAAIVGAAFFAISRSAAHDSLAILVSVCLAGSCAGFLPFNFSPAAVYMGDSGSTVLGLCVAFLALSRPHTVAVAAPVAIVPLLIAALPIADFALAVFRRLRARASPLQGDRFHVYDLMLVRGSNPRTVALVFYAITAALAVSAWLSLRFGLRGILTVLALSLLGLLSFAIWLGALSAEPRGVRLVRLRKFTASDERGSLF